MLGTFRVHTTVTTPRNALISHSFTTCAGGLVQLTEIGLFEAISSCPSLRRLKQGPVDEEKLAGILEAANFAPSGGNTQPWEFIVIKDFGVKRRLGVLAAKGFQVLSEIGAIYPASPKLRLDVKRSRRLVEGYESRSFL